MSTIPTYVFFLQIHFLHSILRRPQSDRISKGVPKMFRRNRNRDSCEKKAAGTENKGIRRIPAGIGNLGAALLLSCHTNWLSHHLSPPSHCAALSLSCCASWLLHCLSPSSRCATLSSTCCASLLSHRLSSSSCCAPRHPIVLSSRRLVVASPLDAPPSCCFVVLSFHLSLSRCTS